MTGSLPEPAPPSPRGGSRKAGFSALPVDAVENGFCFLVAGKSMSPTLEPGDRVEGRPRSRYRPGDVVGFRLPGDRRAVVHRILRVRRDHAFTRGDRRFVPDQPVPVSALLGVVTRRNGVSFSAASSPPCRRFPARILGALLLEYRVILFHARRFLRRRRRN
jgi:hypothetical protein